MAKIEDDASGLKKITVNQKAKAIGNAQANVAQFKVTGADFDAEKMTVDSLAEGLALKVKATSSHYKWTPVMNMRRKIVCYIMCCTKR